MVLSAVVQKDGTPTDIRVTRSLGLGLDERAVEAIKKWRFVTGSTDGHPVAVTATLELHFYLPGWHLDDEFCATRAGRVYERPLDELNLLALPDAETVEHPSVTLSSQVDEQGATRNVRIEASSDTY